MNTAQQLTKYEIERLCSAGGMAPSGGNAQPWKVIVQASNKIIIQINRRRAGSMLDCGYYASYFALGCFVENVLIAASSLGLEFHESIVHSHDLSEIHLILRNRKNHEQHELFPVVAKRATNRNLWDGSAVPQQLLDELSQVVVAMQPRCELRYVSDQMEKKEVAKTLGVADGIRYRNPRFFTEMIDEFRYSHDRVIQTRDGIDLATLELPGKMEQLFHLLREYPFLPQLLPLSIFEQLATPLITGCSHFCGLFLSTNLTPAQMIQAGKAMERIWLLATKQGFSIQPWSILPFFLIRVHYYHGEGFAQPEQAVLMKAGQKLQQIYQTQGTPLFLFRLSKANKPTVRSLKIPWQEFTTIS